jgi:uncharacterized protein YciI
VRPAVSVRAGSYAANVATYAVTLAHGPGWDGTRGIRQQDGWDAHAAFMDGLVADGVIIVGGPLGAGSTTLHAVEAGGEDEVRARFGQDPWAADGRLVIRSIEPWALWLDGRRQDGRRQDGRRRDSRRLDGRRQDGRVRP